MANPFANRRDLEPEVKNSVLSIQEIKRVLESTIEVESRYWDSIRPGTYIYYKKRDTGKMSARLLVKRVFKTREKGLVMFELVFEPQSKKNTTVYNSYVIGAANITNIYEETDPAMKQIMNSLAAINKTEGGNEVEEKESNPFIM